MPRLVVTLTIIVVLASWTARTSADPQRTLDPFVVAPQHFHLEFENPYVRVVRERTAPRERVPMHEHALGGVMVLLTDQNIRQTLPDGSTREIHRKVGEAYWGDPQTHAGENISDKPFEYVRVDVKAATHPLESANNGGELVGSWRLVSAEDRLAGGKITHPFGEHPAGMLVYDGSGHVAIQVMASGRTKWAVFEDSAQTQLGYVAYFGTYDVNAGTHTVTHHIQGHLDPKRLGVDNVRAYELQGNRLTLVEAERPERHVTWERVP